MSDIFDRLAQVIDARRDADPSESYVAKLFDKGLDTVLKKVGEEATETVIAAKSQNRDQVIYETADLWFHTLVMLAASGVSHRDVLAELERRFGLSGIAEKASRGE